MPYADTNGIRLYYEIWGDGPRLLFINGTGGDLRKLGDSIDPLTARFEVLAHDQRGLGRTDKPDVPYSMTEYADDAAALLDAVGWDRTRVIGMSFGGMVAQELTLRHPDRVERLVLCSTSCGGAGGASFPLHEVADLPTEVRIRKVAGMLDLRPERLESKIQFLTAMATAPADPDAVMGARRQIEARAYHDTWDRLDQIRCPTLVAAGRYDGIAPLENCETMAGRIPGARMEAFEGGHSFTLEDPRAFEVICDFLLQ